MFKKILLASALSLSALGSYAQDAPFSPASKVYQIAVTTVASTPVQINPTSPSYTGCVNYLLNNAGTSDAWVTLAPSSAAAVPVIPAPGSPTNVIYVPAGVSSVVASGSKYYVGAITGVATTTLNVSCGTGSASGFSTSGSSSAPSSIVIVPSSSSAAGITPVKSSAAEANKVLKASPGNLYSLSVTNGAVAGYVLLFDATSAPADGAVSPVACWAMPSTTSTLGATYDVPAVFAVGITASFSSTGCFLKTASATATFSAQVK